jgi:acyl-CoA synthetase (NDP forming)
MLDLHDTTNRVQRPQCEICEEVGKPPARAYFKAVGTTTNEQLVAVGMEWAMHCAKGDPRDLPSRRVAFELASKVLGRRASSAESIVVQQAAREFHRRAAAASFLAVGATTTSAQNC